MMQGIDLISLYQNRYDVCDPNYMISYHRQIERDIDTVYKLELYNIHGDKIILDNHYPPIYGIVGEYESDNKFITLGIQLNKDTNIDVSKNGYLGVKKIIFYSIDSEENKTIIFESPNDVLFIYRYKRNVPIYDGQPKEEWIDTYMYSTTGGKNDIEW